MRCVRKPLVYIAAGRSSAIEAAVKRDCGQEKRGCRGWRSSETDFFGDGNIGDNEFWSQRSTNPVVSRDGGWISWEGMVGFVIRHLLRKLVEPALWVPLHCLEIIELRAKIKMNAYLPAEPLHEMSKDRFPTGKAQQQ